MFQRRVRPSLLPVPEELLMLTKNEVDELLQRFRSDRAQIEAEIYRAGRRLESLRRDRRYFDTMIDRLEQERALMDEEDK